MAAPWTAKTWRFFLPVSAIAIFMSNLNSKGIRYGKLSLKSERNNIARLVLEDLTMNIEMNVPGKDETKFMKSQAPPMVIQGIKEDGSMKLGYSYQELLLKTLFPIPQHPLKIGDSVSIPAQMPFNAMGSLVHVTGTSQIKLVDYVQIDGKTCTKLKTAIDISTLNVPLEMEGNYKCQVKGSSIFFPLNTWQLTEISIINHLTGQRKQVRLDLMQ